MRTSGLTRILVVLGAAGCVCAAAAQPPDSSAEHGFRRGAFLTRGAAARPVAMGEVFTAVADDSSAISWNPGGLGRIQSFQALATYDLGGYGLGVSYAAAACPLGSGVGGVSLSVCSYGEYDLRDIAGFKTGTDSATDLAAGLAYAVRNPGFLGGSTGLAVEAVHEAVGGSLIGLSAGSVIPVSERVSAGLAVLHLGPQVGGYSLPSQIRGGAAWRTLANLTVAADAGYGLADRMSWMAVGGEYLPSPSIALRAGYKWVAQDQALEGISGLNAGVGFSIGRIGLDYAFQPYGDMGLSHRISIRYGVGPLTVATRESGATRAKAPAPRKPGPKTPVAVGPLPVSPAGPVPVPESGETVVPTREVGKVMQQARDAYNAGRYAEAAKLLRQVVAAEPLNAEALGYLGGACYQLGDLDEAIRAYKTYVKLVSSDIRARDFLDRIMRERSQP